MGIIPVPTVFGDDCALCWDPGETPSQIKLFVTGIERSPWYNPFWGTAPNQYFDLFQDEHNACGWTSEVGPLPRATFHMPADDSIIQVWSDNDKAAFVSHAGGPCRFYGTNEFIGQAPLGFQGGCAYVTTPSMMAAYIEMVTPITGPDPRMELFVGPNEEIFIRFADKQSATNVLLKLDVS